MKEEMSVNDEVHTCLECGRVMLYGRQDKKFCSLECKNYYHNHKDVDYRSTHRRLVRMMERNCCILGDLYDRGVTHIDLEEIVNMGFNPNCFTGHIPGAKRPRYQCFEYLYSLSDRRVYGIERLLPATSSRGREARR